MPASVVLQKGHVARKTGATGTDGEQALNSSVCSLAAAKLRAYGHSTRVIGADEVYSGAADVFVAHHADGSTSAAASGASVGYPDKAGGVLAHEFKVAYASRGWPHGFRADNYTPGLRGYYGYSRHAHIRRRMVVEAGFMTNPVKDRPWIDAHHGTIAQAICDAVNAVYSAPAPQPEEDDMTPEQDQLLRAVYNATHEHNAPRAVWDYVVDGYPMRAHVRASTIRDEQNMGALAALPGRIAAELGDVADPSEVEAAVRRVLAEQAAPPAAEPAP